MTTPLTRALYRRSFDDGWLDVLVGFGLTLIGCFWLIDQVVLGALVPAVLFPFWTIGRKKLVEPRLAAPSFGAPQTARTRRALTGWVLFGAGVGLTELAFVFFLRTTGESTTLAVAIPAILVGTGLFSGLIIGARRFLVYGLLAIGTGLVGGWAGVEQPGWLLVLAGLPVLVAGLVLLVRFFRDFPEVTDEAV
ncbi:MAG: hypothetical protein CMF75_03655 [Maricaulis sp.]|nr:hypothetical protein [Maricaulis sp.]